VSAVTGGAAFPQLEKSFPCQRDEGSVYFESSGGMTLRDYFAAQALPGIVTLDMNHAPGVMPKKGEDGNQAIARVAYSLADAMLAERVK
jgi:hypothetical protein